MHSAPGDKTGHGDGSGLIITVATHLRIDSEPRDGEAVPRQALGPPRPSPLDFIEGTLVR